MQRPTASQLRNPHPPVLPVTPPAQGQGKVKMESHAQLVIRTMHSLLHCILSSDHKLIRKVFRFVAYVIARQSGCMSSINGSVHRVALIPGEVRRRALARGPACCQKSPASQPMHSTVLADRMRRK